MSDDVVYSQIQIQIFTYDRKLHFVKGQREIKAYPIAVGKPATPTPAGTYHIINKVVNPGGVLGTRWMGLDIPNGPYGIHGTFQPDSIGKAISNGCIRMYNQDVENIFSQVSIGTTVVINPGSPNLYFPGKEGEYTIYVVRPGDTLWQIANQFGLSVDQLAAFNNITDPNNLQVGQELKIPR
jgi:nucleoid-associated protein YgaU